MIDLDSNIYDDTDPAADPRGTSDPGRAQDTTGTDSGTGGVPRPVAVGLAAVVVTAVVAALGISMRGHNGVDTEPPAPYASGVVTVGEPSPTASTLAGTSAVTPTSPARVVTAVGATPTTRGVITVTYQTSHGEVVATLDYPWNAKSPVRIPSGCDAACQGRWGTNDVKPVPVVTVTLHDDTPDSTAHVVCTWESHGTGAQLQELTTITGGFVGVNGYGSMQC